MKYTPLSFEVNLREGFCFAVDSLFAALCELHDLRDARGVRYALVTVLVGHLACIPPFLNLGLSAPNGTIGVATRAA